MSEIPATGVSPSEIEARQDDLLRQLDVLEKRIDRVLADYAGYVKSAAATSPHLPGTAQPVTGPDAADMTLPFSAAAAPVAG
jgi:hypothetical protein